VTKQSLAELKCTWWNINNAQEHIVRMKSFGDATLYCDIEKYDCQWYHCDDLKHVLTCRFLSWSEKSFMTTAAHTHQFIFCSTSSSVTFSAVSSNAKDFESRSAISTIQRSYFRWDECEYATVQSSRSEEHGHSDKMSGGLIRQTRSRSK
jgi:hypothetical protein